MLGAASSRAGTRLLLRGLSLLYVLASLGRTSSLRRIGAGLLVRVSNVCLERAGLPG